MSYFSIGNMICTNLQNASLTPIHLTVHWVWNKTRRKLAFTVTFSLRGPIVHPKYLNALQGHSSWAWNHWWCYTEDFNSRDCLWSMIFVLLMIRKTTGMSVDFIRGKQEQKGVAGCHSCNISCLLLLAYPCGFIGEDSIQRCFDILRMTGVFTHCSHTYKQERKKSFTEKIQPTTRRPFPLHTPC